MFLVIKMDDFVRYYFFLLSSTYVVSIDSNRRMYELIFDSFYINFF